jgi:hypothetical protein
MGDAMHIEIIRSSALSSKTGEYGRLLIDGEPICATCEQPWNDNKQGVSCIPEGDYELLPFDSPAHGHTVVFHNPLLNIFGTPEMIPKKVRGRSLCEIHNANWPFQLKGCVAVGQKVMEISPHGLGVNASVATFAMLMARLGKTPGMTASIRSA